MEISNTNRFGFSLLAFLSALSFLILAYREHMPAQETLSNHVFTPTAFGKIQSSHRAQGESTDLGYAYSVPSNALPERYDNSTHPTVSEPNATSPLGVRFLRIHELIELDNATIEALGSSANNSVQAWFYQGRVVAVKSNNQTLLGLSLAENGLNQQRIKYLGYASIAIFFTLFFYLWPRLLAVYRKFFIRGSSS